MLESVTTPHLSGPWRAALLNFRIYFLLPLPSSSLSPPRFPSAPASGSDPRVSHPAAAASRTEAGAWVGHWGSEPSQRICPEDSACALSSAGRGGSQQHDGLSTHPSAHQGLPASAGQCLPYCTVTFFLWAVGEGRVSRNGVAHGPPAVSLKPHSWGSHASLPFPSSPVQEQECP